MSQLEQAVAHLYDDLLAGNADALLAQFAAEPNIDTPLTSALRGESAFRAFVADQQDWLQTHQAAQPRLLNTIATAECIIAETVVDMVNDAGEAIDLPIAIVANVSAEGIDALRIYHSTWPLTGQHAIRQPILDAPSTPLDEPPIIEAYMTALSDPPDPDAVLALFTDDAYVREPSGQRYRHQGPEGLAEFYRGALADGGIELTHCTATWDGVTFAVEFIADEWAHVRMPPQAGMAVYQTTQNATRLQAVRIYDDVTPPTE